MKHFEMMTKVVHKLMVVTGHLGLTRLLHTQNSGKCTPVLHCTQVQTWVFWIISAVIELHFVRAAYQCDQHCLAPRRTTEVCEGGLGVSQDKSMKCFQIFFATLGVSRPSKKINQYAIGGPHLSRQSNDNVKLFVKFASEHEGRSSVGLHGSYRGENVPGDTGGSWWKLPTNITNSVHQTVPQRRKAGPPLPA